MDQKTLNKIYLFVAILPLFIGILASFLFGERLIETAYNQTGPAWLNGLVTGQSQSTLFFYTNYFRHKVLVLGLIYFAVTGLIYLIGSLIIQRNSWSKKELAFAVTATVFSTLISVFAVELALRINSTQFYIWPPGMRDILKPSADIVNGVEGDSIFQVNSHGLRGDELNDNDQLRILALGGSTTQCLYLDQEEAWPQVLQNKLRQDNLPAWVANAGKAGLSSRSHIHQIKYLPAQIPDLDIVLVLSGINDVETMLERPEEFDGTRKLGEYPIDAYSFVFREYPGWRIPSSDLPFFQRTAIGQLFGEISSSVISPSIEKFITVEDKEARYIIRKRDRRKNTKPYLQNIPDLTIPLKEYEYNLNKIIDLAQEQNLRIIMMTQPVLYDENLSQELDDLLWFGWSGKPGRDELKFYSAAAMETIVDAYNQTMLDVCQDRQVECIDLSARLPKDKSVFFDDSHYNESGARLVAEAIHTYLQNEAPLTLDQAL